MSVFTLDLDEQERQALEAHRVRLGCRSGAETIRSLLLMVPPAPGLEGHPLVLPKTHKPCRI